MRIQYAAINDLESVALEIMKSGNGRMAIVFDPKLGWCVTDEVEVLKADGEGQVVVIKATTYTDWYQPHIANAMNILGGVRFLGKSAMDKLFRKPMPPKPPIQVEQASVAAAAEATGLASVGGKAPLPKQAAGMKRAVDKKSK